MNILQEIYNKLFLTEGVAVSSITDAIKGRYSVVINYNGDPKHGVAPGIRTIQVYVYGLTKAGNPCIRAYQPYGDTASKVPSWKMFRLDRITSWKTTYALFNKPAPLFNPNGDKSMSVIYDIVNFKNPTSTNNVDGPKQKQEYKPLGKVDNIDKILADREKEKQLKKSGEKEVGSKFAKPVLKPNTIDNKNIPEPIVGDEEKGKVVEPEVTPETQEPVIGSEEQKPEEKKDNTFKTAGDEELEKFRDLSKRLENAPIMDVSKFKKR